MAAAMAGVASPAWAQSAGGNPLDQIPAARPARPPGSAATPSLALQEPAGPAADVLERSIVPTRFDIQGVNALPFAQLAKLFSPLVNQPVTIGVLVALTREATTLYQASGHPLSFVFVPEQDFADGVVRVIAVEGYVASVRIEGDAGPAEPKLREIAQRLQSERPLRQATFERVSQLLARVPGIELDATAALPARTDGATELVLKVRRQPFNLSLGADVRQPTSRAVLNGVVNDPFVSGGQLSASTLLRDPQDERLLSLGYTQLIGGDGWQLSTSYSDYRGYPDEQLARGAPLERFNTNKRLDASAGYPLILDARTSLVLKGGFYAVDNVDRYSERATGGELTNDSRVRAIYAQGVYADARPDRTRGLSVLLAQGIDGAGARDQITSNIAGLSGVGGSKPDFTRIAIDANQRDRYANDWGTAFAVGGQYSGDSLATSERVSFGGAHFGRAYAPGDAAGDSGWGASVEVNRMLRIEGTWLKQVEPFLLVEAAEVSSQLFSPMPAHLRSVALGVRLSDSRHYSLDLAVAKPTGDPSSTNPQRKLRVGLLLSYQLAAR
ncbi:POTRA domain-containing protein [Variovorax sp. J22P168]|nr:POTRA domain-containing protein [Variovorax sp. J22P168]